MVWKLESRLMKDQTAYPLPWRRHYPRWIAFVILCLVSALPGLGSSGTFAQTPAAPVVIEAADAPSRATPSGEQTLRLGGQSEGPDSLDPAFSRDLASAFLVRQIFRGLMTFDDDLEPVPAIAQRIEISGDGLTYTFDLRPNATFQDGSPITAEAVVVSLTRALNPETAGGDLTLLGGPLFLSDIDGARDLMAGQTNGLSGLTVVDTDTVQIELSQPRSTFLMKLASAPASIIDPVDAGRDDDWWRAPNGSGPFRISEWVVDDHLTLLGYDGYFAGAPSLQRIEMRLGANALQPLNLYESDRIDVTGVDVTGIDRVMAPESGMSDQVTVTPLFAVDYIAFRTDVEPLNDPNIRRALQLGFPRAKVATVTYDGHVSPASGLIPDGMLGRDWPADAPAYDLAAAKQAIADSSYRSPENVPTIHLYVSGYAGGSALRDVIKSDLGLTIEVINVDWSTYVLGLSREEYPAYELYWGADYPDPESMLLSLFGTGSPDNYVAFSNQQFDDLLQEATVEQDPDARAALYQQAQQILVDENVIMPLYFDVAFTLAKPSVKGLRVTALGTLGLESVWLEH